MSIANKITDFLNNIERGRFLHKAILCDNADDDFNNKLDLRQVTELCLFLRDRSYLIFKLYGEVWYYCPTEDCSLISHSDMLELAEFMNLLNQLHNEVSNHEV